MDQNQVKLAVFAAILSLGSALFVAVYMDHRARWREKRAAAMASLAEQCLRMTARIDEAVIRRLEAGMPPRGPSVYLPVAEAVRESVRTRPQLSDLFMQSAGKIMDIDDEFVWAHINVFIQAAQAARRLLHFEAARVETEVERLRGTTRTLLSVSTVRPRFDFDALNPGQLQQAADHAKYARKHIDAVILGRCAFHNRVLRRAWTPEMRGKRQFDEGLGTAVPKPDPCDGTA